MSERFEEQREQFDKALDRLHEALVENETSLIRDALIQRFEFTFEMAWRCLFRFLVDKFKSHTYQEALAIEVAAFVRGAGIVAFDKLRERLRRV